MHSRFIKRHGKAVFCLLVASIVLRSFIAPGYMFDFSGDNDFGIGIIPCPGPNGINITTGMDHSHHAFDDGAPDHGQYHSADSSICGLLHASTAFIRQLDLTGEVSPQLSNDYYPSKYNQPHLSQAYYRIHAPRAPPAPFLI